MISGATVFQCFYDLEKAFDFVEYNVLLSHLYRVGINGKGWRVINAFYVDTAARVHLGSELSDIFFLRRGVKQGSVLSPLLFLLVIDSLLADLESKVGNSPSSIWIRESVITANSLSLCLGTFWLHDLSPKESINR